MAPSVPSLLHLTVRALLGVLAAVALAPLAQASCGDYVEVHHHSPPSPAPSGSVESGGEQPQADTPPSEPRPAPGPCRDISCKQAPPASVVLTPPDRERQEQWPALGLVDAKAAGLVARLAC